MSLNNHANRLAEAGHGDHALSMSEEAVALRRELAATNRAAFLPDLGLSLNNHALRLADAGHGDHALSVSEEAVALRRELAARNRAVYLPDLAGSLNNHALRLFRTRQSSLALPVSEEAVAAYRELTALNPDAHLRYLVRSLGVHGRVLAGNGRIEGAVAACLDAIGGASNLPDYEREPLVPVIVGILCDVYHSSRERAATAFRKRTGVEFPHSWK
jgi:tetratricopeptide (TPR) repeat protein